MKVHIIQCLCPQRHCIFAIAYEHPEMSNEAGMKSAKALWELMQESGVNPWCALCNSRDLQFEVAISKFATMQEAMPHLQQSEIDQLRTQMRLLAERN